MSIDKEVIKKRHQEYYNITPETFNECYNLIRGCYDCHREITFTEYIVRNMTIDISGNFFRDRNRDFLIKVWLSDIVELVCCSCYNKRINIGYEVLEEYCAENFEIDFEDIYGEDYYY